jgi:hypothetical protein
VVLKDLELDQIALPSSRVIDVREFVPAAASPSTRRPARVTLDQIGVDTC